MIPSYDSFDWFSSLIPALLVLIPVLALVRVGFARRAVFVVTGLYLLALVAPRLAVFHLAFWVVAAIAQPIVAATAERRHGLWVLTGSLAAVLAPMVAWKLWPIEFVIDINVWSNQVFRSTSDLLEAIDFTAPIVAPIGLSFSAFRAADLLIKTNLGLVDRLTPGRLLGYGLFPPLLVVGPIASYDETRATLDHQVSLTRDRALLGAVQILSGLFKVFVIAYLLSWSGDIFDVFDANSVWRIWASLIAFTWFFYANFDGYSDLAIGAGRLLGADLRPNFDAPYAKTNPADFWNSWHISLTRFLRTNVFTAIVGRHPRRQYAGIVITMLLIGLWHSVTWASVLFGVYHAIFLLAHRAIAGRRPPSDAAVWTFLKPALVFAWFGLSLPLLQLDLSEAIDFYGAMMGIRS